MRFFDTLRRNIRKHMKLHLSGKHKKLIGIGALLIVLGGGAAFVYWRIQKSKTASLVPSSGPEGTEVTLAYPKAIGFYPQQATMKFYDASEHGFYAVNNGAASYVAYDPTKGLSYSAQATWRRCRKASAGLSSNRPSSPIHRQKCFRFRLSILTAKKFPA